LRLTQVNSDLANTNGNLNDLNTTGGIINILQGTDAWSNIYKNRFGICFFQCSIHISVGFPAWGDQKIATVSFPPKEGLVKNIVLYSTGTGKAINGRINISDLGEVKLYIVDPVPEGGVTIQEGFAYIGK